MKLNLGSFARAGVVVLVGVVGSATAWSMAAPPPQQQPVTQVSSFELNRLCRYGAMNAALGSAKANGRKKARVTEVHALSHVPSNGGQQSDGRESRGSQSGGRQRSSESGEDDSNYGSSSRDQDSSSSSLNVHGEIDPLEARYGVLVEVDTDLTIVYEVTMRLTSRTACVVTNVERTE